MSNNLNLPTVATNQASKEATINEALAQLDGAVSDIFDVVLSASAAVTLSQLQRVASIVVSGVAAAVNLTLPACKRMFVVQSVAGNTSPFNLVLGTTSISLAAGAVAFFFTDGTANGLFVIAGADTGGGGGGGGGGATTLAGLTDVDLTTNAPVNGQALVYDESAAKWKPVTLTGGGGGGPAGHTYWRIKATSTTSNDGILSVGEMELRATAGGANVATGGTPYATLQYLPDNGAAKAFDGTTAYYASVAGGTGGQSFPVSLGYQFAAATDIQEVYIMPTDDNYWVNKAPLNFDVQYSDDGSAWTTSWSVTQSAAWSRGVPRVFTNPGTG